MALKALLKTLDGLSEAEKALYRKEGEVFILDLEGFDDETTAEVYGKLVAPKLVSALNHERSDRRGAKTALQAYAELGTVEELTATLAEIEKAKADKAKGEGNWDVREKQLVELHNKALAKATRERDEANAAIERLVVDTAIMSAIAEEGGNPKLLFAPVKANVKSFRDEKTKEPVARVVDEKGQPRVGDAQGGDMTVRQFVASLREVEDYAPAFSVPVKKGIGVADATRDKAKGKTAVAKSHKDFKSDSERSAFIREYGYEAFRDLPRE